MEFDDDPTQDEAQEILYELLVDLKVRSKLSAKDCCILSYWIVLSGGGGESLRRLAKPPGDVSSGHYSSKFDWATGVSLDHPNFAFVDIPVFSQAEGCRVVKPVACLPPQLTLQDEISDIGEEFGEMLGEYVADLPSVYSVHPIVSKHLPRIVLPLTLYVDGVQYQTRNSLVGFWLVNMASGRRHLVLTLRKGALCRCGCRGRCSFWVVFEFLKWCLQ